MSNSCKYRNEKLVTLWQITREFHELAGVYHEVISDICCKMGHGMTVFLDRDIDTIEEWNEVKHMSVCQCPLERTKKKKNVNFKGTDAHEKETNACQTYPNKLKKVANIVFL